MTLIHEYAIIEYSLSEFCMCMKLSNKQLLKHLCVVNAFYDAFEDSVNHTTVYMHNVRVLKTYIKYVVNNLDKFEINDVYISLDRFKVASIRTSKVEISTFDKSVPCSFAILSTIHTHNNRVVTLYNKYQFNSNIGGVEITKEKIRDDYATYRIAAIDDYISF